MKTDNLFIRQGNNFPIEAQLSRDGDWTLTATTITLSFRFNDDVVHSVTASSFDDDTKIVSFVPTSAMIDTERDGNFDVQVDDGAYVITHLYGRVIVANSVKV